jgi:sulfide:quinone oxidoreductase
MPINQRHLVVLGAGTAGTMVVNKLRKKLKKDDWKITIVDASTAHHYQPGFLFLPFGTYRTDEIVKPTRKFIPNGIDFVVAEIERVLPDENQVVLANGKTLSYDQLVIATGTTPRPDQTEGMMGPQFHDTVHEFYSFEGSKALAEKLKDWPGGKLVVHITEMPIKCPVAPLEFTFLADDFFKQKGMRDKVEITYVTPLDGAFTKPVASAALGTMLSDRDVAVEPDFIIERVDDGKIVSYDEREIPFDLLVTVPLNMGADFIAASGLGDELNYVPVNRQNFLSDKYDNIFAIGDASNIPASKAGSVAHFAVDLFAENFISHVAGEEMEHFFDGHANCFIESGDGKGMLIDFNYDTQPLPGKYPLPGVGPFSLLEESRVNHQGKLFFKWMYWNLLLKGRPLPVSALMSMAGKEEPKELETTEV